MKKITKILINLAVFMILVIPLVSFAMEPASRGLVPCNNSAGNLCNFRALMEMVNNVIDFVVFKLALPVAAIMFAYVGGRLAFSGGNSENRGSLKATFVSTILGTIFVAGAWLIVKSLFFILGFNGTWIGF